MAKRTEQNLFDAKLTSINNNRLRSRYCTTEPNYRQTLLHGLSATAELLVYDDLQDVWQALHGENSSAVL